MNDNKETSAPCSICGGLGTLQGYQCPACFGDGEERTVEQISIELFRRKEALGELIERLRPSQKHTRSLSRPQLVLVADR